MEGSNKPNIAAEELLIAEFEYIAHTASQANDDRSSVVSFFIIAVGSPLAAFFSTDIAKTPEPTAYLLFTGLFLILSVLGTTTILQLARLRSAWYESMLAMNHMKEFLVKNSNSDISGAFRWTFNTAPSRFKLNSVSFYQTLEVAILAGLLFGAFVFFLMHSLWLSNRNEFTIWLVSAIFAVLFAITQIFLYRRLLK
jgi:hypothetical protein